MEDRGLLGTSMPGSVQPIRFAGSQLDKVRHVCAFFNSEEEAHRILLPFIADGFSCGDKAIHIVSAEQEAGHLQRLSSVGIDAAAARARGQLDLLHNRDVYLRDGRFDQDRMLTVFEEIAAEGARNNRLSRIVCNMDWASDQPAHHHELIEFESRVNDVWSRHADIVICVYDIARFSGELIIDMLRTHPLAVVGGLLQVNPFFETPEQFLRNRRPPTPKSP